MGYKPNDKLFMFPDFMEVMHHTQAKMFANSYYLGYDDINCDQRKRGIGYICERANECNDEKGMVQEGGASFITLLISFKYDLNSLQKFGKCSFLSKAKI